MAVETRRKIPRGEVGHAGRTSPIWGSLDARSYDPDSVELSTFDDMRRTDETVKAALQFVRLTVASKLGSYQHDDEKVMDFVETALRVMDGTLEGVVNDLLSALWAGFAVGELVYDVLPSGPWKGKIYYRKVKVLHPLSVWPKGIKSDRHGNVERIVQSEGQPNEAVLEKGKFVHFVYDGGMGVFGSPWGASALRCVHKWWFVKDLCIKLWGMFMEKFSLPLLVGKFVEGETECPVDGETEDGVLAGLHMLATYQTKTEMAFPMARNPDGSYNPDVPRIDMFSVKGDGSEQFRLLLEAANTGILLGLLVPSLALTEARYGTRAQAEVHLDSFFTMLEDIQRCVSDLILEQLIRPLLDMNFVNLDDYGRWVEEPLTTEDTKALADNLFKLVNSELLRPDDPMRKWVRGKFVPDAEDEEEGGEQEAEPSAARAEEAEAVT
jgi:phage gp29-like protein